MKLIMIIGIVAVVLILGGIILFLIFGSENDNEPETSDTTSEQTTSSVEKDGDSSVTDTSIIDLDTEDIKKLSNKNTTQEIKFRTGESAATYPSYIDDIQKTHTHQQQHQIPQTTSEYAPVWSSIDASNGVIPTASTASQNKLQVVNSTLANGSVPVLKRPENKVTLGETRQSGISTAGKKPYGSTSRYGLKHLLKELKENCSERKTAKDIVKKSPHNRVTVTLPNGCFISNTRKNPDFINKDWEDILSIEKPTSNSEKHILFTINLEKTFSKYFSDLDSCFIGKDLSVLIQNSWYCLPQVDHDSPNVFQPDTIKQILNQTTMTKSMEHLFSLRNAVAGHINSGLLRSIFNFMREFEAFKKIVKPTSDLKLKDYSIEIQPPLIRNFKYPIITNNKKYKFDTLNLIMSNVSLTNYILDFLNETDKISLKKLMRLTLDNVKNFGIKEDTDLDFFLTNPSEKPLEIFKKLFKKGDKEKYDQKFLYFGKLKSQKTETAMIDSNNNPIKGVTFKYESPLDSTAGPLLGRDNIDDDKQGFGLPLLTLRDSSSIYNNENKILSIRETLLGYKTSQSEQFLNSGQYKNFLRNFESINVFINEFPFLIINLQPSKNEFEITFQKVICEMTIHVLNLNKGLNKYKLTGFWMKKTSETTDNKKEISYEAFYCKNGKWIGCARGDNIFNTNTAHVYGTTHSVEEGNLIFTPSEDGSYVLEGLIYQEIK
ncbi:hypothetical protein CDIK_3525 [Cucumispora dikerogammari]|nr:hypothetical protein CDIK_3525 [Cucumispora dikerogammari]